MKRVFYCLIIVLTFTFIGCPADYVEIFKSPTPQFVEYSIAKSSPVQKFVVFELYSIHPVLESVWRIYESETGGSPLVDVEASHQFVEREGINVLILTYIRNDLPEGEYWVTVQEDGSDESERVRLEIRAFGQ